MSPVVSAVKVPVAVTVEPGVVEVGDTATAGVESDRTVTVTVRAAVASNDSSAEMT
jgi:hypothetical protein